MAFGPKPRSHTFKVNRKARRKALRSALSVHAERGSLAILGADALPEPATKAAAALLEKWGQRTPTLVVVAGDEERNAALSFRNIPRVAVLSVHSVGVADIIGARSLVVSEPALETFKARTTEVTPRRR